MWNALTFRCVWRCVDSYAVSTQATEVTATTCSDLLSHYVQFSATGNEIFRLNIHTRLLQHLTWLQKHQVCMQAAVITSAVSPKVLAVAMASYSCGLLLPACLIACAGDGARGVVDSLSVYSSLLAQPGQPCCQAYSCGVCRRTPSVRVLTSALFVD